MTEWQQIQSRIDALFAEKRTTLAVLGRLCGGGSERGRGGARAYGNTTLRDRLRRQLGEIDREIGRLKGRLDALRGAA